MQLHFPELDGAPSVIFQEFEILKGLKSFFIIEKKRIFLKAKFPFFLLLSVMTSRTRAQIRTGNIAWFNKRSGIRAVFPFFVSKIDSRAIMFNRV
jgi:hypothetical protein